jgi:hypothetical protein
MAGVRLSRAGDMTPALLSDSVLFFAAFSLGIINRKHYFPPSAISAAPGPREESSGSPN